MLIVIPTVFAIVDLLRSVPESAGVGLADLLNFIGVAVGVTLIGWGTLWGRRVELDERHTRREVPDA